MNMKWTPEKWFYSVTVTPHTGKHILSIYDRKVLKHQEEFTYFPGEATINKRVEQIKAGTKNKEM